MSTFNFNPPPPPQPPPPRPPVAAQPQLPPTPPAKSRTLLWVVIGGGAFFLFVLAVFTLVYLAVKSDQGSTRAAGGLFSDKIGVVELEGVIFDAKPFIEQFKRYEDDSSIKAIVIEINSPGGGSEASQELYQYVKRYRDKKKKPVVSAIRSVGASGAYYVAAGTNKIFASKSSIVGSIGVIAQWVNYGDLLKWAKLKDVTMKAGELKDAGNPARDLTPAEQAYFQELLDNMHTQFIADVASGRGAKKEDIRSIATGRVWTGEQAKELKLIDEIGDFQEAVEATAKMVDIKGEPTLVRPTREKRTLADILFGDISDLLPDKAKMLQEHVGFYYLWRK
ncbi:MAG: signal peptide peptidase SppA [Acidobacteriales bacterium]|nr:signal peptide peptidase SppA [Terriglobales bacterium]